MRLSALGQEVGMNRLIAERYRLLAPLGAGGMGTVWRARDELLSREVAVKEVALPAGLPEAEREQLRERTRREARHAARLDSPHAVTVYDVVEQDGHPFLVMELVEARTLADVIRTDGPLPPRRVAEVGLAVLSALEAAHAEGIVHRDVKPSNVLLRRDGRVVLSDFGIATSTGDASLTSTGLLLGSPSYISPERARGLQPAAASDLWSLGATLLTAVEGRAPYDTGEALTTVTAIVAGEPAPFLRAGPLGPALSGLLERDPATRLDAAGARRALQAVLSGDGADTLSLRLPAPAAEPTPPRPPAPTARRRSRRTPWVLAGVVVLVAAAGLVGFVASTESPDGRAGTASGGRSPAPVAVTAPASWSTWTGAGLTLRYPPGWEVGSYRGAPQLRDPATHRTVRIGSLAGDPLAALTTTAASFARSHAGYQQLALEQRGVDEAVWEMTYSDGGADLHAADWALVRGGHHVTLFTQARQGDWAAAAAQLRTVVASLRVA
jgi:hypothetical protein